MAILDLITVGDPTVSHVDADPSAGGGLAADIGSLALFDNAGAGELYLKTGAADTAWTQVATGATGEANTASNQGAAGVGLFKQKTGSDLEFKNVNAGSSKITITDDVANDEVDIDVDEASLDLANIGGSLDAATQLTGLVPVANGGTGVDGTAVTAGQLLIGNATDSDYDLATLTAGDNISIVNADGSITVGLDTTGVAAGSLLIGNGTDGDFDTATLSAGSGIDITNADGSITIAATGGPQVDTVSTTDATLTTAATVDVSLANSVSLVKAKIVGVVTGGAGGNNGGTIALEKTFHVTNFGGTVLHITQSDFTSKFGAGLSGYLASGTISGSNLLIQVQGGASDNVNWRVESLTTQTA